MLALQTRAHEDSSGKSPKSMKECLRGGHWPAWRNKLPDYLRRRKMHQAGAPPNRAANAAFSARKHRQIIRKSGCSFPYTGDLALSKLDEKLFSNLRKMVIDNPARCFNGRQKIKNGALCVALVQLAMNQFPALWITAIDDI